MEATNATTEQADAGTWRVTLDVKARKVVVDSADVESEVPMNDLVEVGVFAAERDGKRGKPLYLRMHRVRAGEQSITVTVPQRPARAGIDARILLIDVKASDNIIDITHARR